MECDDDNNIELCVVCQDTATGFHYRCMTCEGCKGFFRRTIQKGLQYQCKASGSCAVNKTTRNQCQKCRYDKCIQAGMAVDLVLDDDQRVAKRLLIEGNRQRRKLEQMLTHVKHQQDADMLTIDNNNEIVHTVTQSYCGTMDVQSISLMFQRCAFDVSGVPSEQQLLESVVNPFLYRAIAFAKQVEYFNQLPIADQTTLLKANWVQLVLLTIALQYDGQSLMMPDGTTDENATHPQVSALLQSITPVAEHIAALQVDNTEAAVVAALLLINSDTADVTDRTAIDRSQNQLIDICRRYELGLIGRSSGFVSGARWAKLMLLTGELRALGTKLHPAFTQCHNAHALAVVLGNVVQD